MHWLLVYWVLTFLIKRVDMFFFGFLGSGGLTVHRKLRVNLRVCLVD